MNQTITAYSLTRDLDQLLDPTGMSDFGPNGLIIPNEGAITKIATAFTPSLEIIEKAAQLGVQALITHHGLQDVFPITSPTMYKKIKTLITHNIALLRYHLPLDAHQDLGNNWKAAKDLGWQNLEYFGECQGSLIGVRGTFAPVSTTEFVAKLEKYYGNNALVAAGKTTIASAALISGGAHKYITQALHSGVDCFITGTTDDPAWDIAHEEKIVFCALGHAATEKVGPKALVAYLKKRYGIEAHFIDTANQF
jgi:dinuclear metal center YbgI/SA1388 family protein